MKELFLPAGKGLQYCEKEERKEMTSLTGGSQCHCFGETERLKVNLNSVSHESAGDSARVQLTVTNIVLSMAKACAVKLLGDQLDGVEVSI